MPVMGEIYVSISNLTGLCFEEFVQSFKFLISFWHN